MLIASLAVAALLSQKRKGVGIFRVLCYIPVLTSWVAASLIWKSILSPQFGAINNILGFFEDEPENRQNQLDREEALRKGLCVKNNDGSSYTIPECFEGKTTVYVDEQGNIPVFLDCKYIDVKKLRDELWKI